MTQNETLSVKRIPFYLFLVLLGFLLFYVYDTFLKKKNDGAYNPVPTHAGPITKETADAYVSNYLSSQDSLGDTYKLVTQDGKTTLRGFWLSKETLKGIDESIRKADPKANIVGYSVYFGKTEPYSRNKSQFLTLVVRGTIPGKTGNKIIDNKTVVPVGDGEVTGAGDYYDSTEPCPDRCGEPVPPSPDSMQQR